MKKEKTKPKEKNVYVRINNETKKILEYNKFKTGKTYGDTVNELVKKHIKIK